MPDLARKTISATEMSGLFGISPYVTKWMLWQRFANGMMIESAADNRMSCGSKLEPLLIAQAAQDLKLEVKPNRDANGWQEYVTRNLLGCSRDATIIAPDLGPGALETKCVFDYATWMREWDGGKRPPPHYEIQLQVQMYVGDGVNSFEWGTLAVFVCGDMKYFNRHPIRDLWKVFEEEAEHFFMTVREKLEPPAFGKEVEWPLLRSLYPPTPKLILDYQNERDAFELAEDARMFNYYAEQESGNAKAKEKVKYRLLAAMKGAEELLLPNGIIARQRKHGSGVRVTVYVPSDLPEGDISFFEDAEFGS